MAAEMTESVETDDLLKITIKEEPLDYVEGVEASIPCEIDIKDEPEDKPEINDGPITIPHPDHTYVQVHQNDNSANNIPTPRILTNEEKNSSPVGMKDAPVTRKIMINGQEKTCVLVKMPQFEKNGANVKEKLPENAAITPSKANTKDGNLKVQCPRCKNTVELKNFRQHIDTCPPKYARKPEGKKSGDSVANHKTGEDLPHNVPTAPDSVVPKDNITNDRNAATDQPPDACTSLETLGHNNLAPTVKNENETSSTGNKPVKKPRRKLFARQIDLSCLNKRRQNILKDAPSIKEAILTHLGETIPSYTQLSQTTNGLRQRSKSLSLPSRISALESEKGNERSVLLTAMAESFSKTRVCGMPKSDVSVDSNKEQCSTRRIGTRSYSRAISEKYDSDSTDSDRLEAQPSELTRPRSKSCSEPKKNISADETVNQNTLETKENSVLQTIDDNEESFPSRRIRTRSCSRMMNDKSVQPEKTDNNADGKSLSRRSRSKSCSRVLNKDAKTPVDNIPVRKMRSKSVQREKIDTGGAWKSSDAGVLQSKNGLTVENEEKIGHASQMAYYQKFLEVRSRSVSNKSNLSEKSPVSKIIKCAKGGFESDSVKVSSDNHADKYVELDTLDNSLLLEDNTLSCSMCSFTTDKQKTLKQHERNHRRFGRPVFKCIYCNQKYTRYALYLHIQTVHPGQKFDFIEDTNTVEKPETFTCKECPFSAKTQILLTEHTEKHVGESGIGSLKKKLKTYEQSCDKNGRDSPLYKCPKCSYATHIRSRFDIHRKSHKKNLPIKPCPNNNCSFRSTCEPLKAHLKKCTSNITNKNDSMEKNIETASVKTKSKKFQCPQCNFSSILKIKMNLHMRKKHSGTFKCPHCSLTTSLISNLRQHLRCHKANMPILKCEQCDYRATPSALKTHLIQSKHLRKSDHVKNSQDTSTTKSPVKIKPQENPSKSFPCKLCSFVYTDLTLFKNHMLTHEQNLPNNSNQNCDTPKKTQETSIIIQQCKLCPFVSTDRNLFKKHTMTHEQSPPNNSQNLKNIFRCKQCSYTCDRKRYLKVHLGAHRKRLPIEKCQYCDFRCTPTGLLRHITTHNIDDTTAGSPNNKISQASIENSLDTLQRQEDSKTLFKCPQCSFSTNLRIKLKIHSKNHEDPSKSGTSSEEETVNVLKHKVAVKRPRLRCSKCSFTTSMKSNLVLHSLQLHSNDFKCELCSVTIKTESNFKKHLKSQKHRNNEDLKLAEQVKAKSNISNINDFNLQTNFKCAQSKFPIRLKMHKHKTLSKSLSKRNELIENCPYCTYTASNIELLKHIKRKHKNNSKFVKKKNEIINAKGKLHNTNLKENKEPKNSRKELKFPVILKCNVCSFVTTRNETIREHVATHKQNQPIEECLLCNFRSTPRVLLEHAKTHKAKTNYKIYKCELCSADGLRASHLSTHMDTHARGQPIEQCTQCEFKSTRSQLQKHIKKMKHPNNLEPLAKLEQHNDSKKVFKCSRCSVWTHSLKLLALHLKTHSQSSIKKCPKCSFKSTSLLLSIHMREKKHYEPTAPDNSMTETSHLNKNMKQINCKEVKNSFSFQCDVCSFSTSLRIKLNVHKSKMHPELCKVSNNEIDNNSSAQLDCNNGRLSHNIKEKSKHNLLSNAVSNRKSTDKQPIYKCPLCSYTSPSGQNLKKHVTAHRVHNFAITQCTFCDFKGTPRMLTIHKKNCLMQLKDAPIDTHKVILLRCNVCPFATYTPSVLKFHHENKHKNSVKTYKCRYCSFTSYWEYLVDRHMHSHTILKMPIKQCTKCDFKSTPAALAAHINRCLKG